MPPRPPPCATPAACCARPARPASPRARRGSFRSSSLKNEARSFSSSRLFLASVLRFRKKKALRDDRRGNRARRRSTRPFPPNAPAFPRSHAFSDANDPRRYKRGWFCSWCSTVYRKREEEDDPALGAAGPGAKLWVGCDRCDRWSHLSCELANDAACLGTGREVPFEAAPALCFPSDVTPRDRVDHAFCVDQKTDTKTETVRRAYHCPSCRERDGEKKKINDAASSFDFFDRDPSWASSPLSRAAGATLAAGVVAHCRPYLREREGGGGAEAKYGAETRESRKRGRDARADVCAAPRVRRAAPKEKTAEPPAERKNPPKPKPEPRREPEPPLEELTEGQDSIAARVLGSAFGSVGNALRGVPKAARTSRGRPRAARAEAAAEALGAAEREPKTAAATNRPAADDDEKANATETAAADETTSPTDDQEAHEVAAKTVPAAATAPAAAPASAPEANSPPRAAQPSPLRGGMGSPRGLRLLRPSAQGAAPFPARGGGLTINPTPPDPNAGTLYAVNAFVAGGVRPGGSMLVRLLAESLGSGSRSPSSSEAVDVRGAARALPPVDASRANARGTLPARLPARSSSSWRAVGLSGSARLDDGDAHKSRVGGVFVDAERKNVLRKKAVRAFDVREDLAKTFSFGFEPAGLDLECPSREEEDVLLHDADADPWGLGLKQEWSDAIDWGDST